jgi:hypothetical protein
MKTKLIIGLSLLSALIIFTFAWIVLHQTKPEPVVNVPIAKKKDIKKVDVAKDFNPTLPPVDKNEISDSEARLRKLQNGVSLRDIPDALRFLQSQENTEVVRDLMIGLIRQWADGDTKSAIKWVENMPISDTRKEAFNVVAITLANHDIDESIRWVSGLPAGEERNNAVKYVGYEIAMTEPVTALKMAVDELSAGDERNELIKYASLQWASSDPESAMLWADQITDETLRESVLVNVATAWSENDPSSAAGFAMKMIAPGRAQDDAVISIAQRWAQVDLEAASKWIETFPAGVLHDTAVENIRNISATK